MNGIVENDVNHIFHFWYIIVIFSISFWLCMGTKWLLEAWIRFLAEPLLWIILKKHKMYLHIFSFLNNGMDGADNWNHSS